MSSQITKEQIIQDKEIADGFKKIAKSVGVLNTSINTLIESAVELNKQLGSDQSLKELLLVSNKVIKSNKTLLSTEKEIEKQKKALHDITIKLGVVNTEYNKGLIESRVLLKKKNDAIKEEITGEKAKAEAVKKALREEKQARKENTDANKKQIAIIKEANKQAAQEVKANAKMEKEVGDQIRREEKERIKELERRGAISKQQSREYMAELNAMAKAAQQFANEEKKKNAEMQKSKAALDAQRTKAYTEELKKQATATKLLITAQQAEKGSKQQLAAVNAILQNRMKGLNVLIPEQKAKYEQLSRAVNNNKAKMAEMDSQNKKQTSSFGNLIKSIGVYAAAMFGISRIIQFFTRDLLDLTKKLDSLDFSMKTVIKRQEEQAQTQLFLSRTAFNYGQDILTLTERYIKFRAAAQQSNMSMKDTMKIFDSTAKAAAVLGLKTDEVNGVFLALEQMISKGKITTEELRRQLGERLPGSMGIMADAIGVDIVQLDKMLKAGTVLSSDALPKFAVALEEAYGIESLNKVENLAAAHGRLRTSWVQFVKDIAASKAYIGVLNFLTDTLIITQLKLGDNNKALERFERLTDKSGDTVRKMVEELDKLPYDELVEKQTELGDTWVEYMKKQKLAVDWNKVSLKNMELLFETYVKRRKSMMMEDERAARNITPFDAEEYKKILDSAQKEYEDFSVIQSDELKKQALESAAFYKDGQQSYKDYLINQLFELDDKTRRAENLFKIEQESQNGLIASGKKLTKEQSKELEQLLSNYQNYVQASILARKELDGIDSKEKKEEKEKKPKKEKDDSLKILQEQQKLKLEALKQKQQKELRIQEEFLAKEFDNENDRQAALEDQEEINNQKLLQLQIDHQTALLNEVEKGSLEEAKILADREKLYADSEKSITEAQIKEREHGQKRIEEILKDEERQRKEQSKAEYDQTYDTIVKKQTDRLDAANIEIQDAKGNANAIRAIEDKLALDLLQIEEDEINRKLAEDDFEVEEKKKLSERLLDIDHDRSAKELDITKRNEEEKAELREQAKQKAIELVNEGFNIAQTIYSNQMAAAEQQHNLEVALAGNSVEKKILADRKYEKEKAKIRKKQANAEKAQAAFGIITNTAMAIVAMLKEPPPFNFILSALVGGIGAVQLANVLVTKIPEFVKGAKSAPETFIAGEKGQELIVTPKGETMLTPDKATLYSDKSLIGSTILPHDETQRMLANYAINSTYDSVDMSESNSHLRGIRSDLKNKREIYFEGKYKIVKQGSRTTRYAVR